MYLFIVLLILYGIPAAIGILLLRALILHYYSKKTANIFATTLFSLLILTGVGCIIWDRIQRTHYISYSFCEDLRIELRALEIDTFLDWQVNFEMVVKDSHNHTIKEFEFDGGNGPYFEIALEGSSNKVIVINGYGRNSGFNKKINLGSAKSKCRGKIKINGRFTIEEQ